MKVFTVYTDRETARAFSATAHAKGRSIRRYWGEQLASAVRTTPNPVPNLSSAASKLGAANTLLAKARRKYRTLLVKAGVGQSGTASALDMALVGTREALLITQAVLVGQALVPEESLLKHHGRASEAARRVWNVGSGAPPPSRNALMLTRLAVLLGAVPDPRFWPPPRYRAVRTNMKTNL
jgi:hypothetical protein